MELNETRHGLIYSTCLHSGTDKGCEKSNSALLHVLKDYLVHSFVISHLLDTIDMTQEVNTTWIMLSIYLYLY